MSLAEAIEITPVHSVDGLTSDRTALVTVRPFRAPHHTISDAGLTGGQLPIPGDVSLAYRSTLFLDERPEFRPHVLGVLRQPLKKSITLGFGQSGCQRKASDQKLERLPRKLHEV
jgi:magnesium chelatase family protein